MDDGHVVLLLQLTRWDVNYLDKHLELIEMMAPYANDIELMLL